MQEDRPPKAFISYAWTSQEHKAKVLELAQKLRADGVDVRLDRWHLREGNDATVFMESMVTDASIHKVILIFDRVYVEKADGRSGGVGKETQIVTSKIYGSAEQNKFVGVAFELGSDGKPYIPAYYGERIYIDFFSDDALGENYERLLRWLHGQPADVPPPIGAKPSFLQPNAVVTQTASSAQRAARAIKSASPAAKQALADYLDLLLQDLKAFIFNGNTVDDYITFFTEITTNLIPAKNEFLDMTITMSRSEAIEGFVDLYNSFFERLIDLTEATAETRSYLVIQFDHFKFFARELFLLFVAVMLDSRQFEIATKFLEAGYFSEAYARRNSSGLASFEIFDQHVRVFDALNEQSSQRYYSLHGKILHDRSLGSSLRFESIMQADLVLYLRSEWRRVLHVDQSGLWYPVTYPYMSQIYRPLELFARAESAAFFDRIKSIFGLSSAGEFKQLIKHVDENSSRSERNINVARLTGAERVATK